MYSTLVESMVTYEAEVWTLTRKLIDSLQATDIMNRRRCCKPKISDRILNEEIESSQQAEMFILIWCKENNYCGMGT